MDGTGGDQLQRGYSGGARRLGVACHVRLFRSRADNRSFIGGNRRRRHDRPMVAELLDALSLSQRRNPPGKSKVAPREAPATTRGLMLLPRRQRPQQSGRRRGRILGVEDRADDGDAAGLAAPGAASPAHSSMRSAVIPPSAYTGIGARRRGRRPQNPKTPKPQNPKTKPQNPKTPKPQNPKTPKPQKNPKTPKPQNPKTPKPQNKPQNPKTPKPQTPKP